MKIPFTYYLHDDASSNERAEAIYNQVSGSYRGTENKLADLLGDSRPFYEVGIKCELDTVTGEVTLLGVEK